MELAQTDLSPDEPALGRRERSKRATRQRLFESAIRLFVTRGYDETSIDDIAEDADVSRTTAFNYFPRKRAFLEQWSDQRRAALRDALAAQDPALDAATQFENLFAFWAELYERDADASRAIVRYWITAGGPLLPEATDTSLLFAATIRAGQQRGDLRGDVDANIAALALLDTGLAALTRWAAADRAEPGALERHLADGLHVILSGLLAR
jgi:TetR/AcrR family transcriptional regulator, cholesterol catabolism regulator